MLPCGRYYYDPEGGYVGNPWVKFSIQYVYIYLCFLLHHLDFIDHYVYKFYKVLLNKTLDWYNQFFKYTSLRRSVNNFEQQNSKL